MVVRNIAKLLRGKATPMQVFLAGLLGGLLGFVPSLGTAPGLLLLWIVLLLVLNANIGLCLFVAAGSKIVALLSMPLAFAVGRWLLEGPTRGLFEAAVNAPVLAWCGLEYYVTTGGLLLGAVLGTVIGWLLMRALIAFRGSMSRLEVGSEAYNKVAGKWWSRFMLWLFVGGRHGKLTYAEMLAGKKGSPIRIFGVVFAALLVGGVWFAPGLFAGGILTRTTRSGLEAWNGATVDLAGVDLDLAGGRLTIDGLALADPNALDTDLFRATRLEAVLGTDDLLRKKFTIDRLVVVDGASGAARAQPGQLIGPPPEPPPPPAPKAGLPEKSLDEYLADAKQWKQRLSQLREWLDGFSKPEPGEAGEGGAAESEESLSDRLAREVAAKGWAHVAAERLVHDAPALLIREMVAEGLASTQVDGLVDLRLTNLSTQPALVPEAPRLSLRSQDGRLDVDIALGGASAAAADNTLRFVLNGVPTAAVAGSLRAGDSAVLSGGTLDFSLDGQWLGGEVGQVDLPLAITLRGVTVALPSGARRVDQLTLPFGLRGPLDNPAISFDDDALQAALLSSAKAEVQAVVDQKTAEAEALAAQKKAELEAQAAAAAQEAGAKAEDEISDALGGLFGGSDKTDEQKAAEKKAKKKKKDDGNG